MKDRYLLFIKDRLLSQPLATILANHGMCPDLRNCPSGHHNKQHGSSNDYAQGYSYCQEPWSLLRYYIQVDITDLVDCRMHVKDHSKHHGNANACLNNHLDLPVSGQHEQSKSTDNTTDSFNRHQADLSLDWKCPSKHILCMDIRCLLPVSQFITRHDIQGNSIAKAICYLLLQLPNIHYRHTGDESIDDRYVSQDVRIRLLNNVIVTGNASRMIGIRRRIIDSVANVIGRSANFASSRHLAKYIRCLGNPVDEGTEQEGIDNGASEGTYEGTRESCDEECKVDPNGFVSERLSYDFAADEACWQGGVRIGAYRTRHEFLACQYAIGESFGDQCVGVPDGRGIG